MKLDKRTWITAVGLITMKSADNNNYCINVLSCKLELFNTFRTLLTFSAELKSLELGSEIIIKQSPIPNVQTIVININPKLLPVI